MLLNLQNLNTAKSKLKSCDVSSFHSDGDSFVYFISKLEVILFRHIVNLPIDFSHPVTVISGSNKVGKTSLLILLACSHEKFMKVDSTSPNSELREHVWRDVINFTKHESETKDYSYKMQWRVGHNYRKGEGKRLASSKAWSGLAKKSSAKDRFNAKIPDREVRLIDLERILPARSFSNALFRKANVSSKTRLNADIEKAFCYIFDLESVKIYEAGKHINRCCFFIVTSQASYSSYNAASGEESTIYLLQDVLAAPKNSLILIDEVEAGFHPTMQRRLADLIQYISWRDKKQFIISTHSPTFISAFPRKSRIFIENISDSFRAIKGISAQAAASKMDSVSYPLLTLYCEDELASFLIRKIIQGLSTDFEYFGRLVQIIESGSVDQVKNDYIRHKRNFSQLRNKIGYSAVFDGDYKDHRDYSYYYKDNSEKATFIYPFEAAEKFLVKAYLKNHWNKQLSSALALTDHHSLFEVMVNLELSSDVNDARNQCYDAFIQSQEYIKHKNDLREFLINVTKHFSELNVEFE